MATVLMHTLNQVAYDSFPKGKDEGHKEASVCPVVVQAEENSHYSDETLRILSLLDTFPQLLTQRTKQKLDAWLLREVRICDFERPSDGENNHENKFINVNEMKGPNLELLESRSYFSEPGQDKALVEESPLTASYGTTNRAEEELSRSQLTTATDDALLEDRSQTAAAHLPNRHPSVERPVPNTHGTYEGETVSRSSLIVEQSDPSGSGEQTSETVTTIMVCNLPCRLSPEGLTKVVDELGFSGCYDSVYVPKGNGTFLGYGFVTFKDPQFVPGFWSAMSDYSFPSNCKQPYCKIAAVQALASANLKRNPKARRRRLEANRTWYM